MRVRTKMAIVLSPFLVVATIGLIPYIACGCADVADVPSTVDDLPPDVLAAARDAMPEITFSHAVKMVQNKTHVLLYRLKGRDISGVGFEVVVYPDLRTQVSELSDTPLLEPVDPPARPPTDAR